MIEGVDPSGDVASQTSAAYPLAHNFVRISDSSLEFNNPSGM